MRKKRNDSKLRDIMALENKYMLFIDGHDNAILGTGSRCGMEPVAVYNRDVIRGNLVKDGQTEEEADLWIENNIASSWIGDHDAPILLEWIEL
jgi:hypothetical protein